MNNLAQLMEPVARHLLGKPHKESNTELRYGNKGSLSIDLEKGTFYDWETHESGGVLKLIEREKPGEDARSWLRKEGFLQQQQQQQQQKARNLYFDFHDEKGQRLFREVRRERVDDGKRLSSHFERYQGGRWLKGTGTMKDVRRVLYRLPLLVASEPGSQVVVVEGPKKAEALLKLGFCATCNPGGAGMGWRADYNGALRDRDVVVLPDNDPQTTDKKTGKPRFHKHGRPIFPGQDHAANIAQNLHGIARRVRVLMLPNLKPKGDVIDWLAAGGTREELEKLAAETPDFTAPAEQTSADEIARLAQLSLAEYERERKAAAKALGIRASVLDKLVQAARESETPAAAFAPYQPAGTSVDGDALLRAIEQRIRRHIAADKEIFTAAALWTAFAWTHDAFVHSPMLLLTSKEPNSGKTTLLELLKYMVPRGLSSAEISAAALYRVIAKWNPTILVDEADTIFRQNDDLRQVVNSGWTRGTGVIRCNPDTLEPELFPTFAPKVIGMKGLRLPDTTLSRSIVATMKRKRKGEIVGDFMHQDDAELQNLRGQLARWAQDNIEKLRDARPVVPDGLQNRLAANWRPLFAIADLCGGDWPERARTASRALSKENVDSLYVQVLAAIRDLFDAQPAEDLFGTDGPRMFSQDIVDGLIAIEDGPWKFYAGKDRDKPITQNGMARLLTPIVPQTVRIGGRTAKGYYRHQFEDEFERYLRDDEAANEEEASADVQLAADGDKGQSPPPQTDDEDIPF